VPLRAALGRIEDYALVVFVSPNAVSYGLDTLAQVQNAGRSPVAESVPVAVVGPSSVVALAERVSPRPRIA
jgi:uroporphyrinogen III methyltransferase/synthase